VFTRARPILSQLNPIHTLTTYFQVPLTGCKFIGLWSDYWLV